MDGNEEARIAEKLLVKLSHRKEDRLSACLVLNGAIVSVGTARLEIDYNGIFWQIDEADLTTFPWTGGILRFGGTGREHQIENLVVDHEGERHCHFRILHRQ